MIQNFNIAINEVVGLVDICDADAASLGSMLRGLNTIILESVKAPKLQQAMELTAGSGGNSTTVILDNYLASKSIQSNHRTIETSQCIFVQAFNALHKKPSHVLRSVWDGDRVFQVTFRGESGSDAGGVFREGMSRMVEDLFSDTIDLFKKAPNALHDINLNRDKFVVNPAYDVGQNHIGKGMYEFVGKLMGISLRTNLSLPFLLSSVVWKGLCGIKAGVEDLNEIDSLLVKYLEEIKICDEASFGWKFGEDAEQKLVWTCTGVCGEVMLLKGGGGESVSFEGKEACRSSLWFTLVHALTLASLLRPARVCRLVRRGAPQRNGARDRAHQARRVSGGAAQGARALHMEGGRGPRRGQPRVRHGPVEVAHALLGLQLRRRGRLDVLESHGGLQRGREEQLRSLLLGQVAHPASGAAMDEQLPHHQTGRRQQSP